MALNEMEALRSSKNANEWHRMVWSMTQDPLNPTEEMRTEKPDLIKPSEVQARLSISKWTLGRLVRSGRLTGIRVTPSRIRFDPRTIDRYILENSTQTL
jgi:hypothetical protein